MSKSSVLRWGIFAFLLIGIGGCYEPTNGCLDLQATNFDVDVDEACSDCCTFPEMRVRFQHVYQVDDTTLTEISLDNTAFFDDFGNPFRFNRVQFYISDFRLVREDGSTVGVLDTIGFDIFDPGTGLTSSVVVEDNFLIANPLVTDQLTLGEVNESGSFIGVRFFVGLEGQNNQALPNTLDDTHPLSNQNPAMYTSAEEGYIFTRMALFQDTIATDTIPVEVTYGGATNLKQIELAGNFSYSEGFNIGLVIQIDYSKWFTNISVPDDAANGTLTSKIVENLTKDIFTIVALE
ncbi:MAG: MbnP family protein [Bacteroidota bacterium]